MNDDKSAWYWAGELAPTFDAPQKERHKQRERVDYRGDPLEDLPYQIVLTGKPFKLNAIEFRIVQLLASRPYHAFATAEIVAAANEEGAQAVTDTNLREHIVSLRRKLGFFADFVQSVPHIGYRFKP